MEVEVKREEINLEKYGWYIKEYIIKFLKDNHILNNENKNKLQNIKIYAENLKEQNIGRMVSRSSKEPPEIAIDFCFFLSYEKKILGSTMLFYFSENTSPVRSGPEIRTAFPAVRRSSV